MWLKLYTVKIFPDYLFSLFVFEEEDCAKAINPSLKFCIFRDKELRHLQWNSHLLIKLRQMTVMKMKKNMHLPTVSSFSLFEVNADFIKLCFGEYCQLSNAMLWVLRKCVEADHAEKENVISPQLLWLYFPKLPSSTQYIRVTVKDNGLYSIWSTFPPSLTIWLWMQKC